MKNKIIIIFLCLCSCGNKKNEIIIPELKKDSTSTENTKPVIKEAGYQDTIQDYLNNYKEHLNNLLTEKRSLTGFKEISEKGEIWIGDLFNTGKKYALIAYQNTDSTMKIDVLKQTREKWDTVIHYSSTSYFDEVMLGDGIIDTSDFNGDDQPDLRIIYSYWHIYPGECSYLWLVNNDQFKFIKGFEEITSPQYDKKTNKIYSYQSDGCSDMSMAFAVYEIRNLTAKELDNIYCDCCDCESGNCLVTRNGLTKTIEHKKVHLSFPEYFREKVKWKVAICDK